MRTARKGAGRGDAQAPYQDVLAGRSNKLDTIRSPLDRLSISVRAQYLRDWLAADIAYRHLMHVQRLLLEGAQSWAVHAPFGCAFGSRSTCLNPYQAVLRL
jgi:hypothetical protein